MGSTTFKPFDTNIRINLLVEHLLIWENYV